MATHELGGNPCNIGTRNWRQPDQCPISSIIQIRLKILMKTLAMLRNCAGDEMEHWSNANRRVDGSNNNRKTAT